MHRMEVIVEAGDVDREDIPEIAKMAPYQPNSLSK